MSVTDKDSLEAERDFLLQSILKLDEDHELGALSDEEYKALRDEQTIRAAQVLEALDQKDQLVVLPDSTKPKRSLTNKQWTWIGGCVAFVIMTAGILSAVSSGRLNGQNSTGSVSGDSNTLLARAQEQTSKGKVADAVKTYDAVLKTNPNNVQALTYKGWLIRLAGLPNDGLASINKAIAAEPTYPDAHFFKGFIIFRDQQNPAGAIPEFQTFLASNPPADMVPLVQQTLADAQAQAAAAK